MNDMNHTDMNRGDMNQQHMSDRSGGAMGNELQRLSDTHDLQVAEGYPNIKGWEVQTRDGQKLGKVDDLVVSPSEMRVRYLDVDVKDRGHALIPVGTADLDDDHDIVFVNGLDSAAFDAYPAYLQGGQQHTGQDVGERVAAVDYDHEHFDDQRLFARRRNRMNTAIDMSDDQAERLTVSEEELAVGKRQVQAGEVGLRKTVETEHVREQVPLMHEEITVERRPIDANSSMGAADIGTDQEIRVPLMREEAVVSKRVVPREEIIVRKRMVTETETVEADLRRERLDESGLDAANRGSMRTTETTRDLRSGTTGIADRAADALDDVKDRFDGNPASRPGRDMTDRPGR